MPDKFLALANASKTQSALTSALASYGSLWCTILPVVTTSGAKIEIRCIGYSPITNKYNLVPPGTTFLRAFRKCLSLASPTPATIIARKLSGLGSHFTYSVPAIDDIIHRNSRQ